MLKTRPLSPPHWGAWRLRPPRAVDAEVVADRLSALAISSLSPVRDIDQGIDLLITSDDVDAMSAVVGMMSLGDVERGLALLSGGGSSTIASIMDELDMPILSAVLDDRGMQLPEMAVEVVLRAAADAVCPA